jgi:hypothetical protein
MTINPAISPQIQNSFHQTQTRIKKKNSMLKRKEKGYGSVLVLKGFHIIAAALNTSYM